MARPNEAFRGFIDRWFPERQILIRGPGRMSSFVLSQRLQTNCAAGAVMAALMVAGSGLGLMASTVNSAKAAFKISHLRNAEASTQAEYDSLQAEYARMQAARDAAQAAAKLAQNELTDNQAIMKGALASSQAMDQASQAAMAGTQDLAPLIKQTQASLAQVETIIKATGLDPDQLASQPGLQAPGELAVAPAPHVNPPGVLPAPQSQSELLLNQIGHLQSLAGVLSQMPLASPVTDIAVSSPFGFRPNPWTGIREFHVGVDLTGPVGTPVFATAPGLVSFAGVETGYGQIIIIDHGYGLTTRYSHLHKIMVAVGDAVDVHQEIGQLGNTGWSTGPHLLYETRLDGQPYNPLNFIKVSANVQN